MRPGHGSCAAASLLRPGRECGAPGNVMRCHVPYAHGTYSLVRSGMTRGRRADGDPCGSVMFCHVPSCGPLEMSCFVMRGRLRRAVRPAGFTHLSLVVSQRAPPNRRPGPRLSPRRRGGQAPAVEPALHRLRRRARALRLASPPGRGEGRLQSSVPPSRQRAGRGVPVLRAFRVCVRAGAGGCRRRRGSRT